MKILTALCALSIMTAPTLSFAAPSGERKCHDKDKKVEVSFGTYASEGPPVKIIIGNMEYLLEAEFGEQGKVYTNKNHGAMCFCEPADGPLVGSGIVKVLGDNGASGAQRISLSLEVTIPWAPSLKRVSFQDLELSCEVSAFRPGNEQDDSESVSEAL